jgi:hypothetical protein
MECDNAKQTSAPCAMWSVSPRPSVSATELAAIGCVRRDADVAIVIIGSSVGIVTRLRTDLNGAYLPSRRKDLLLAQTCILGLGPH